MEQMFYVHRQSNEVHYPAAKVKPKPPPAHPPEQNVKHKLPSSLSMKLPKIRYLFTTLSFLIVLIYLLAFLEQMISKGWRDKDAQLVVKDFALQFVANNPSIKVGVAQQYTDGCSFFLLEIYWRRCFSIRFAVPISETVPSNLLDEAEALMERQFSVQKLPPMGRNVPTKITLLLEAYEETEHKDGSKYFKRRELNRKTFEVL